MAVVTTPFVLELHPNEEYFIVKTADVAQGATKNHFSATVHTIMIQEERWEWLSSVASSAKGETGNKIKYDGSTVCVSLVVNMSHEGPDRRVRRGTPQGPVTLVSYIFNPHSKNPRLFKRSEANRGKASPDIEVTQGGLGGSSLRDVPEIYHISLKKPLMFNSESGNVISLNVKAYVMEGSWKSTNLQDTGANVKRDHNRMSGLKPYHGLRKFVVRLIGMQQTELSGPQVALFLRKPRNLGEERKRKKALSAADTFDKRKEKLQKF